MEQDMVDPQVYMTPEAIRSTLASVASAPLSSAQPINTMSVVKSSTSDSSVNFQNRTCGSPSTTYSLASSANCTVATSSGSSSPVAKRFHMSSSGPSSPVRTNPPMSPHGGVFKAPQTPPAQRRVQCSKHSIAQYIQYPGSTPFTATSASLTESVTKRSVLSLPQVSPTLVQSGLGAEADGPTPGHPVPHAEIRQCSQLQNAGTTGPTQR